SWLPKDRGLVNSPSGRATLKLLVDLCEDAISAERNQGLNPIAAGLSGAADSAFAGIVAAWLFHPELETFLRHRAMESWRAIKLNDEQFDPTIQDEVHSIIQDDYISRLIYTWILPRGFPLTP